MADPPSEKPKLRLKAGALVDVMGTLSAALDDAEAEASAVMNGSFPLASGNVTASWRAIGLEAAVLPGTIHQVGVQILAPFKPHWLIVSTPGFQIRSLDVNREYRLLENIDADLFLWSNWDALKSVDMLDRVRIADTGPAWDAHTYVSLVVQARPQLVTFKGQARSFRAMILGEELTMRLM